MTSRGAIALIVVAGAMVAGLGCGGGQTSTTDNQQQSVAVVGSLPNTGKGLLLPKRTVALPAKYPVGSVLHFRIPVANGSDRPLRITTIDPGCVCTEARAHRRHLAPGQRTWLNVSYYTSIDGTGTHTEAIRVYSTLDSHPPVLPTLKGFRHLILFKVHTSPT